MSCFWDALLRQMQPEDAHKLGVDTSKETWPSAHSLLLGLQRAATTVDLVKCVLWQGEPLSVREAQEHASALAEISSDEFGRGHWTGSCDSVLLYVCALLQVSIDHRMMGIPISYVYKQEMVHRTLILHSNSSHMWV